VRVVIIGAGRMGSALAARSVNEGHETRVLCRLLNSRTIRPLPDAAVLEEISSASQESPDLVLIAAPAWADPRKEALVTAYLSKIDKKVPVCSTAAYPGAPNRIWSSRHPFLRVMCSAAIGNPKRAPLVVISGESRIAFRQFEQWIRTATIQRADSKAFDRLSNMFIATAVHCETLRRIEEYYQSSSSWTERRFAALTLLEAFSLMEAHSFDAADAFDVCLTPRGMTGEVVRRFLTRKSPPKVANRTLKLRTKR
jgi:hypothetical protein